MHTLFALLLAAQVGQGLPVRPPSDVATVPRDFAITVLGLNADGVFAFTVANHGNAVTQPFKVSAYLDGYLRETVQFNIRGDLNGGRFATPTTLPFANGERRFTLTAVKVDLCSSAHRLRTAPARSPKATIPSGSPVAYDRLGPGETLTIHAGNAYIPDGISVHVVIDPGNLIQESNENNNVMNKSL